MNYLLWDLDIINKNWFEIVRIIVDGFDDIRSEEYLVRLNWVLMFVSRWMVWELNRNLGYDRRGGGGDFLILVRLVLNYFSWLTGILMVGGGRHGRKHCRL